ILLSRYQMQADNTVWSFLNQEIGALVELANTRGLNANARSLIYGQIMLIITAQYLPAVSNFLGDQIAEQAAIQNMASDISAFIIEAESGFNALSSSPDCTCTEDCNSTSTTDTCTNNCTTSTTPDCVNEYNFYSGIMSMVYSDNGNTTPEQYASTINFSFNVLTPYAPAGGFFETNILTMLTDTDLWQNNVPLSSSQASQISTALLGIAGIFNPTTTTANVNPYTWVNMNLDDMSDAICSWNAPYGSTTLGNEIYSGNAPLVWTQPATVQANLNTAAQTVEGVATSTQTTENFQVQEIDQFYGITNSIQMSQEQQCASMVKQQTT
ncbi:MAG: hypothetical protein JSS09_00810, partial [Verrucomicrobia bacterium]|nr:hypothetical protein [Verrucomicrobiota bacterium]